MKPRIFPVLLASSVLAVISPSVAEEISDDDLFDLSLEELISMEVTSVSRKKQRLMDSAAAVYVVTQEDIRRSGVTTIPDALRMVPGVQVAQMNSNTWSISARGFNYVFANKLLVLMDGRTLYTPAFSGVHWDIQDTLIQDIDRIEVIRGPGAALWGANAVNGVINIITKKAKDTQGSFISAGSGNHEKAFGSFRHGNQLNEDIHYRVYYKSFRRDSLANSDGSDANDDWKIDRFGFRLDWQGGDEDITVQGDIYTGTTRPPLKVLDTTTATITRLDNKSRDQKGGNVIIRWNKKFSDISEFSLKAYYDSYDNYDYRIRTVRDTVDIETQHRYQWLENQELIWGLGYRSSWFNLSDMNYVEVSKNHPKEELYSAYIQDEIQLASDWHLTLSSRLEHHTSTGYEFQPNARIAWLMDDSSTLWASVSKAVRTPSISERLSEVNGIYPVTIPGPLPGFLRLAKNEDIESEKLTALELGYREQLNESLSIDIATFYNQYDDLHSLKSGTSCPTGFILNLGVCASAVPYVLVPAQLTNGLDAKTYGMEIAADWEATSWWRIKADFSVLQVDASRHDNETYSRQTEALVEGLSAKHMANLRSMMTLPERWFLDLWVRYMDHNKSAGTRSYTSLDVRLAHQLMDGLELSLVGKNLFESQKKEFNEEFSGLYATEIEESWYAQVQWHF